MRLGGSLPPHSTQNPVGSSRDKGQSERVVQPGPNQDGRPFLPVFCRMLQQNQAPQPLSPRQPESRGLGSSRKLSQDHLPLRSHLTEGKLRPRVGPGLVWALSRDGRTRFPSRPPVSHLGAPTPRAPPSPLQARPTLGPTPRGPATHPSTPLHACTAHGDLAGPQAAQQSSEEMGMRPAPRLRRHQTWGGPRTSMAAELIQGVDGRISCEVHRRTVREAPDPGLPPQSSPPIKLHHSRCLPHSVTG